MTNEALSAGGEMKPHVKTYSSFIRMAKIAIVLVVIITAGVIFLIAS